MNKYLKTAIAALGLASMTIAVAPTQAATHTFTFGDKLVGPSSSPSTATFAFLTVNDDVSNVWDFRLTINNSLFSYFGNNAFIGSLSLDVEPDVATSSLGVTFLDSNLGGVTSVQRTNGNGTPSWITEIDFGTKFGQGAGNRLSQNDYVHWSVSGLAGRSLTDNMYVHVQGLGERADLSAKYTPTTPVPEPETYAMLLAGLGLVGLTIRRRKQSA